MVSIKTLIMRNKSIVFGTRSFLRRFFTWAVRGQTELNEIPITSTTKQKEYSDIKGYLISVNAEHVFKDIPTNVLRKSKKYHKLFLINPQVARSIASLIADDLLNNQNFIIECNPGIGILTKELLAVGVRKLHLYQNRNDWSSQEDALMKLVRENPKVLDFRNLNFINIWKLLLGIELSNTEQLNNYMQGFPKKEWTDNPFTQIITICPDKDFFTLMMYNLVMQTDFFNYGRPRIYAVLPGHVWKKFTANNKDQLYYKYWTVMFQIIFEYSILAELPREAFVPWNINMPFTNESAPPETSMYLIRIEPRASLYSKYCSQKKLAQLWYFLQQNMRLKSNRIIPSLERLIPGCGPRLIVKDIDLYTTYSDLTPSELLKIFNLFSSWEEYDPQTFMPQNSNRGKIIFDEDEYMLTSTLTTNNDDLSGADSSNIEGWR